MLHILHFVPFAHIISLASELSTNYLCRIILPGKQSVCTVLSVVAHETSEAIANVLVSSQINAYFANDATESQKQANDPFASLTFSKFIVKAISAFSLSTIAELYFIPGNSPNWVKFAGTAFAGSIGTQIPDWYSEWDN